MMDLKTRRYVYGIALAAVPLLIVYGLITAEVAPLWVAMAGAVLVPGLALANPTEEPGRRAKRE